MKQRSSYICQQCGYESPQWYGKCPGCGEWNSMVETLKESDKSDKFTNPTNRKFGIGKPQKLSEVKHIEKNRLKSGFGEFDRVVGGGIVPGSVTLVAGDPGIGKSTLLLHILSRIGGLYVSGEESAEQIKLRAKRMGVGGENITVLAENSLEGIIDAMNDVIARSETTKQSLQISERLPRPSPPVGGFRARNDKEEKGLSLVIIDSIQTLHSDDLSGMSGSVGQIRYSAEKLVEYAKTTGIPIIIIGHVTKEGEIAGPKILEHMVDTVLYLEGERYQDARILRTLKNRFGAVEEVGIFEMREKGLLEIANPSEIFLKDRVKNVPGSVVTVILEGSRPLLIEIQALAVPSQLAIPRRVGNGVDYNRLQLLTAVLQKRLGVPLGTFDIFVNVSGGLKIAEPAADLAICLAILSSFKNKALDPKTAAFGEVGLLGEIRGVGYEERRIKEAKRLGFKTVITSGTGRSVAAIAKLLS
jgi:DNA repair protein RadA/Sms